MTHEGALEEDIFAALPRGGPFLSGYEVAKRVAPQREREVRTLLYTLARRRVLDLNRGGGGWPWLYGRSALVRRI
jgi:hypothetical protein